ncbi:glycine cleavage system protein R [Altererythrobacter sp. MF3-039]|uniref:glycine cleavage system protein R n=1 Tax=Altererythrobacter sp. MF3-039 TaxID=3252901 RepID=UPI00390CCFCE
MAQTRLVLTVTGNDRPGLTSALADAIVAVGGNWQEGHFSRLGGLYVGSVLVELEASKVGDLEAAAGKLDIADLRVVTNAAREVDPVAGQPFLFELVGSDRPGIISQVTGALARLGANIESLSSHEESAAWGGEKLFRAEVLATLPDGVAPEDAQDALEAISGEIMVDFTFADG